MSKNDKQSFFIIKIFLFLVTTGIFLLPKITFAAGITAEKIITLTNEERQTANLDQLSTNALLSQAAQNKARAIFTNQSFQHNFPEKKFSSWIKEVGYDYSYVGENLALNFLTDEGVINAWLNSPTHKNNLLNKNFSEIGVAVIRDDWQGQPAILVVQIFGAPLKDYAANGQMTRRSEPGLVLGAFATAPEKTNEYYQANFLTKPKLFLSTIAANKNNSLERRFYYDYNANIFCVTAITIVLLSFIFIYLIASADKLFRRKNKILLSPLK